MKKVLFPILVLLVAGAVSAILIFSRPDPTSRPVEVVETPVITVTARAADTVLTVSGQGTVLPQLQATVAAEVGGRILEISESFEVGNFVSEGDLLLQIDPTDYRAAVAEAKANARSAETTLAQAKADAEQAIRDLKEVGVSNPTPLARREPQLEQARLRVDSAEAALALAETNLERTRIRAPFDGLIIEKFADRGDVIANRGTPVATLYGTEVAEIELPLSRHELSLLDLPSDPESIARSRESKPEVTLTLGEGTEATRAVGWIDRLAGTADPITRLRMAFALVEDPLNLGDTMASPLPFGSFVSAEIQGKRIHDAYRIPVVALIGENRLRVVDGENRLRERSVAIAQRTRDEIVVTEGLRDGDEVCLTPLKIFSPGMLVRIENEDEPVNFSADSLNESTTGS